jgi:hypothetical protein
LIIGGNNTLLLSLDGGSSFNDLSNKLTYTDKYPPYLQNIISNEDTLYIPTTNDGVFVSYDNGVTFSKINGLTGASGLVYIDSDSWMTYGSSSKCKYTNNAGTNWEGCYPGSTVFGAEIYSNNIITLCKSKIFKQDMGDLDSDVSAIAEIDSRNSSIAISQNSSEIMITAEQSISRCTIYSITGQIIYSTMPQANTYSLSTANYTDGIYIINAESNGISITKKFIVK